MTKQNTTKAAQPGDDLRQRAARARDAAGRFIKRAAPAQPSPAKAEPDPALAVATVFRATWKALNEVLDAEAPDELVAELDDAQGAAYDRLRTVRPTTPAGYRALADAWALAVGAERGDEPGMMLSDQAADSLIAGAAACTAAEATIAVPHPDASLLALGAGFVAAWTVEEEAPDGAGYWACNRLAQQIVQTPAVTVAGLGIKALLLARLDEDDSCPRRPAKAQGPLASHWNVLRQVQQGAVLLADAPDMGIPMSVAAKPETGFPVTDVVPSGPCAPVRPALSQLSIYQLARLYGVVARTAEVIGGAENAPCFWNENRTERTPGGCIIDWEAQRLDRLASEIVLELRRRQPDDENEAEERANTLLSHMVLTGGVAEHPELIAEINATWGA